MKYGRFAAMFAVAADYQIEGVYVMKGPSKAREMMNAEDNAVAHLGKFPREVALATALMVETLFAGTWYAEQNEMIEKRDPREVFAINSDHFRWLREVRAMLPPGVQHDDEAMQHLIYLFADLPYDRAWLVAHKVTKWEAYCFTTGMFSWSRSSPRSNSASSQEFFG